MKTSTDWQEMTLGDIGETLIGLTYSPSQVSLEGTLVLRSSNIKNGALDLRDTVRVTADVPARIRVKRSDILICVRNGSRALIGKSLLLDRRVEGETFGAFMAVFRSPLNGYLSFFFQSNNFKRQVDEHLGATINQITNRSLKSFRVLIPPAVDRSRITTALSDVSALIQRLEALVAKKRSMKQGLMQQLLTGKTRLPGFDGEWAQTSMGESGLFSGAGVDKTSNTGEPPVRLLNYVDVYREEFVYPDTPRQMVTASTVKQRQCDIQAGDVFFTPTSETPDDIGRSAVSLQDAPGAVYSYHLVRWRPRDSWDPIFLGFAFNAEFFRSQVVALASGSGARYVISMPGFRSLKISQPPVEEQAAIGRVLRDSSIQIEILTNRLTKVRSIKQGMMQELLTGRTRLLPAGDSV